MGRGGGLVFTGMPRRREVLGTGIIRWEKVINPDGSVTWQEAQPTTASGNSQKEEKGTKVVEKQKLERPSWIESKKESTNNTKQPAKHEVEDLAAAQKEPKKVEEVRPRRAFSFHQTEEKKAERAEKTTHVEEVRFGAPIRRDDEKKGGVVAGLATKFGSTRKTEDMPNPKKDMVEVPQPTSTYHTLHLPTEEKHKTPPPPLSPSPTEEKKNPIADDYFSHSHWSIRDDSKQESDAELAQRLANTEKIFRQQEQKIQAALDRIRDLERQLASGFAATSGEQDEEVQTTKTWDNESIAAGGRESGPHLRQLHHHHSKGPLPCFSDEPHYYRVLTVNSNKPQVTNNVREQQRHHHHEGSSTDIINNSDDDSRTPSPIAVSFNIPVPVPAAPPTHHQPVANPISSRPKPFVLQSLKPTNTPATTTTTKKHKPLPLLPTTDARAIRPGLRSSPSPTPSPTTPTTPSPTTTPTKPSFCIPPPNSSSNPGRPRPAYHRSVSNFKNKQRTRPLTPIPEEPCPLKRRPRVPRMRRSMSRSMSMSMSGDCGVRPGSGNNMKSFSCEGREGVYYGGGWRFEGEEGMGGGGGG